MVLKIGDWTYMHTWTRGGDDEDPWTLGFFLWNGELTIDAHPVGILQTVRGTSQRYYNTETGFSDVMPREMRWSISDLPSHRNAPAASIPVATEVCHVNFAKVTVGPRLGRFRLLNGSVLEVRSGEPTATLRAADGEEVVIR